MNVSARMKHEMAGLLLERGADAERPGLRERHAAVRGLRPARREMIALLERHGGTSNPSMAGLYRRKDLGVAPARSARRRAVAGRRLWFGPRGRATRRRRSQGRRRPEILTLALQSSGLAERRSRGGTALLRALSGSGITGLGHGVTSSGTGPTYLHMLQDAVGALRPPVGRLRYGTTALHEIVTMGDHVTAEERVAFAIAALDAGAPTALRDDTLKSTPLGWASRWGREELVRLFLDRGADPVEREAEPWATPLAWAEKKGHSRIVSLLRDAAASNR